MKKNAFTLIELLSVIVIFAITFLIVVPSMNSLIGNSERREIELIEERVLSAAKEYVNNIDGSFYKNFYKEGDTSYVYKSDLINAGLIDENEISKLNTFAGVKGELLSNERIKYTIKYINASNNEYTNEELYLMIKNLQNQGNISGGSGGGTNISLLSVYPVGSIYMSTVSTSPEELFGGEWEQLKDRFLLGAGDTYKAGSTGGAATHTLTIDEMPGHTHNFITSSTSKALTGTAVFRAVAQSVNWPDIVGTTAGILGKDTVSSSITAGTEASSNTGVTGVYRKLTIDATHEHSGVTETNGGSQPHNNMPPYITVYMWKRTA